VYSTGLFLLSRIDKDAKDARNRRIFNLWMACYTQQEVAEAVGNPAANHIRHF